MTSAAEERESTVLELLRERYESEGYEVFLHPSPSVLPPAFSGYRPDAIAVRPDDRIVIEVQTKGSRSGDARLQDLVARFANVPGWRFVLFTAPVGAESQTFEPPSILEMQTEIDEARHLLEVGSPRAALVIAWAVLESIVHVFVPVGNLRGGRSHTAMQVVQQLEMRGLVKSDVARRLRKVIPLRNAVVHGDLKTPVDPSEVLWVIDLAQHLLHSNSGAIAGLV
jgi:uncharacterized protein YutE (UPF0331/DUF86 family)